MSKEEVFSAKIRKSGGSKIITIPKIIAEKYEFEDTVKIVISKDWKVGNMSEKIMGAILIIEFGILSSIPILIILGVF